MSNKPCVGLRDPEMEKGFREIVEEKALSITGGPLHSRTGFQGTGQWAGHLKALALTQASTPLC
jgi:hypothetical protein